MKDFIIAILIVTYWMIAIWRFYCTKNEDERFIWFISSALIFIWLLTLK